MGVDAFASCMNGTSTPVAHPIILSRHPRFA